VLAYGLGHAVERRGEGGGVQGGEGTRGGWWERKAEKGGSLGGLDGGGRICGRRGRARREKYCVGRVLPLRRCMASVMSFSMELQFDGLEELESGEISKASPMLSSCFDTELSTSIFNASALVSWDALKTPATDGPAEVLPGLFLGDARHAEYVQKLKGVSYVLNLSGKPSPAFVSKNCKVMSVEMEDRRGYRLTCHFESCLEFIRDGIREGGVLVYCEAGVNRSVAVVAAYLLVEERMSMSNVLSLLKSKRGVILTNTWFMAELVTLACRLGLLNL